MSDTPVNSVEAPKAPELVQELLAQPTNPQTFDSENIWDSAQRAIAELNADIQQKRYYCAALVAISMRYSSALRNAMLAADVRMLDTIHDRAADMLLNSLNPKTDPETSLIVMAVQGCGYKNGDGF